MRPHTRPDGRQIPHTRTRPHPHTHIRHTTQTQPHGHTHHAPLTRVRAYCLALPSRLPVPSAAERWALISGEMVGLSCLGDTLTQWRTCTLSGQGWSEALSRPPHMLGKLCVCQSRGESHLTCSDNVMRELSLVLLIGSQPSPVLFITSCLQISVRDLRVSARISGSSYDGIVMQVSPLRHKSGNAAYRIAPISRSRRSDQRDGDEIVRPPPAGNMFAAPNHLIG